MKHKSLKSQVTMLIIVGLLLLIVVSFILYLSKPAIKKISQQSIKKTHETAIDTRPIKEFITKCLDKLAKDAVILLGKQGGRIYTTEGGTLIDYKNTDEGLFFVKYRNINVAYNILPPMFDIPPYSSEVPDYPWATFPYEPASNTEIFGGYFGVSSMPPLGPSGGPHSMQTQIKNFIDNNIASCADFSIFEKQGFNIVMKQPNTSVIIGRNDITIKSTIPITIINPATNEFTELSEFSTNLNIRLRDIYFFIKELIRNDIQNITFNMSDIKNNKDLLNVQVIKNIISNNQKSDLIIITDERSPVYGKPFEYTFGRRNRAPALYYIQKNDLEFECNHLITQDDLTTLQGNELKAVDPDEDNIQIEIIPQLSDKTPLIQKPVKLNMPQIKFKVEVNDNKLSDYQVINVTRKPCS